MEKFEKNHQKFSDQVMKNFGKNNFSKLASYRTFHADSEFYLYVIVILKTNEDRKKLKKRGFSSGMQRFAEKLKKINGNTWRRVISTSKISLNN